MPLERVFATDIVNACIIQPQLYRYGLGTSSRLTFLILKVGDVSYSNPIRANCERHQKSRDTGCNFSVYYTVYYIRVYVLLAMDANNVQWLSDHMKGAVSLPIIYEGRPILDTH